MPGATDAICAFVNRAAQHHVERIVLLSGRGEEEAQACERIVQESGLDWTIVRASWFHQNFSEGAFVDMVQAGQIALPVGKVAEPFIDADDIADVSAELSRACNREIALVEAHEEKESVTLGAMFFLGFLVVYVLAALGE